METILVTGAAGFIGSNLAESLLEEGFRVIGVDNFDDTYDPAFKEDNLKSFKNNENFVLYRTDIRDIDEMRAIFEKERPQRIAHLAAKADTRAAVKDPYPYLSVNILGTLNILELAREFNVTMTAIASSGSVYGNNPNLPWKEDENTDFPLSAYGMSKKADEMLAYTYHHNFGMNIVCLRYFNAYGEKIRPTMMPYKWAMSFLKGEEIELSGEGTRRRDLTYVGDTVRGTIAALKSDLGFEIFNIGNSSPITLRDLIGVFEKVTDAKVPVRSRESHNASVEGMHANVDKAKRLLNWEAQVSVEEGVSRLVAWVRANRLEK